MIELLHLASAEHGHEVITEPNYIVTALIAVLAIGMCAPLVGTFVVQRKLSLIGEGLGHVAAGGVGIALWLGQSPKLIAIILTIIIACLIEWSIKFVKNPDSALALIFYSGIAASVTFASEGSGHEELEEYLFGNLLHVSTSGAVVVAITAALIAAAVLTCSKLLVAIAIDEDSARVVKMPIDFVRMLLMVSVALIVSISMSITGLLLISAVMIVPVLSTRLISNNFKGSLIWAVALGTLGSVTGLLISDAIDTAPGGTIVLTHVAMFIVVSVVTSTRNRLQTY